MSGRDDEQIIPCPCATEPCEPYEPPEHHACGGMGCMDPVAHAGISVGDIVYFPNGPIDFHPDTPHKVVCVDPFQVTAEIGGRSFGPYMLTKDEVATCGMTREARS